MERSAVTADNLTQPQLLTTEMSALHESVQDFLGRLSQVYFQNINQELDAITPLVSQCFSRVESDKLARKIGKLQGVINENIKEAGKLRQDYERINQAYRSRAQAEREVEDADFMEMGSAIERVSAALTTINAKLAQIKTQQEAQGVIDGSIWRDLVVTNALAASTVVVTLFELDECRQFRDSDSALKAQVNTATIRLSAQVHARASSLLKNSNFSVFKAKDQTGFEWYVRSLVLRDYLHRHRELSNLRIRLFLYPINPPLIYEGTLEQFMQHCNTVQQRYGEWWGKGVEADDSFKSYTTEMYKYFGGNIQRLIDQEIGVYSTAFYLLHTPASPSLSDPFQYNTEIISPEQIGELNLPIDETILLKLQNHAGQELKETAQAWLLRSPDFFMLADDNAAVLIVAELMKFYLILHRLSRHVEKEILHTETVIKKEMAELKKQLIEMSPEVNNKLQDLQSRKVARKENDTQLFSYSASLPVLSYTLLERFEDFFDNYFFQRKVSKDSPDLLEAIMLQQLLRECIKNYYTTFSRDKKIKASQTLQRIMTRLKFIDKTFEPILTEEIILSAEGTQFFMELYAQSETPEIPALLEMLEQLIEETTHSECSVKEREATCAMYQQMRKVLKTAAQNKQNVTPLLTTVNTAVVELETDSNRVGMMKLTLDSINVNGKNIYLSLLLRDCFRLQRIEPVQISADSLKLFRTCYANLLGKITQANIQKLYLNHQISSIFRLTFKALIPMIFLIKATQLATDTAAQQIWVENLLSIVGEQGFFHSLTNTPIDLFVRNAGIKMLGSIALIAFYFILKITMPMWDAGLSLGLSIVGLPWLYRRWIGSGEDRLQSLAIARPPNSYWEDISGTGIILLEATLQQWKLLASLVIFSIIFRSTSLEVIGDTLPQSMKKLLEIDLKLLQLTGLIFLGVLSADYLIRKAIIPVAIDAVIPVETQAKVQEYWDAGVQKVTECASSLYHRCFKKPDDTTPLIRVQIVH